MLKKSLFVVAAVAMLAATASAGEFKTHSWPTTYVPQEVTDIPVVMDVGYWVAIKDQDELKIKLEQESVHKYSGCATMNIECNFNLTLSCSISAAPNAPVTGDLGCSITSNPDIDAPGGSATVCASLSDAALTSSTGGMSDVHVANVTIKVVPRS
jgi:hypothetical protein